MLPISPFSNSLVVQEFPRVVLAGRLSDPDDLLDPMEFFHRFHVDYETVKAEGYRPIFLALANSGSGEASESFGLFEKMGKKGPVWFEVSGSESSIWEFDGQWEPELTTPAVLWHRLTCGALGMQDHFDVFSTALKTVVLRQAPELALESDSQQDPKHRRVPRRHR